MRERAGLKQREVAERIPRADGRGPLNDQILSYIEQGAIRIPRGFTALYLEALNGRNHDA